MNKVITVDDIMNFFTDPETGLLRTPRMIILYDGVLVFDSNLSEEDDCGIVNLPTLETPVCECEVSKDGTLTIKI